jgi:hypothetical protein
VEGLEAKRIKYNLLEMSLNKQQKNNKLKSGVREIHGRTGS